MERCIDDQFAVATFPEFSPQINTEKCSSCTTPMG